MTENTTKCADGITTPTVRRSTTIVTTTKNENKKLVDVEISLSASLTSDNVFDGIFIADTGLRVFIPVEVIDLLVEEIANIQEVHL